MKSFIPFPLVLAALAAVSATAQTAVPVASGTNAATVLVVPDPKVEKLLNDLQQEQRVTQRLIENLREQASEAKLAREVADARLKLIERTLTEQRDTELKAIRDANRQNVALLGFLAVLALGGVGVIGWFLWRAMNRMGELPTKLAPMLNRPSARAALLSGEPAEQQARLIGLMDRLEDRMRQLEAAAEKRALPASDAAGKSTPTVSTTTGGAATPEITSLLAKGQQQFQDDQLRDALDTYESVLRLDPDHTEALVRRGKIFEKLRRLDEAIECYDHALSVNPNLTVAYLSKGGVLNRLERFNEALECYEQALRTQQNPVEPGPIVIRE
jgi:tetratricopeptide (TPR) repeat protein